MRLSQQTEWIVIGVLILYIAFMPSLPVVGSLVGAPVGKAIALAGVVYAWKYISAPIALLLLVSVLRTGEIRERFTGNCPNGYSPDETTNQCKNNTGQTIAPVICMSSQKWDQESGMCKAMDSKPSPKPVDMELPLSTAPPGFTPNSGGSGAGGPPGGTTGAAAAQLAMNVAPSSMATSSGGVSATAGKTTSSTSAPV